VFYFPTDETYEADFTQNRVSEFGSFILPPNQMVNFVLGVSDDSTAVEDLINTRVLFSEDMDDYSNSTQMIAQFLDFGDDAKFWLVTFNSSDFPANTTIFFRIYTNDGEQAQDTELPRDDLISIYKTFFSLIVQ